MIRNVTVRSSFRARLGASAGQPTYVFTQSPVGYMMPKFQQHNER